VQDRGGSLAPATETNYFKFIQWDITSRCNLSCIHCRSESFYGEHDLAASPASHA